MRRTFVFIIFCVFGFQAKAVPDLYFTQGLDFIKNADAVYLYYSPAIEDDRPPWPERNKWIEVHGEMKQRLINLFSKEENYFKGSWGIGEGPAADHIRICFQKGKENLLLKCGGLIDGVFKNHNILLVLNLPARRQVNQIKNDFLSGKLDAAK